MPMRLFVFLCFSLIYFSAFSQQWKQADASFEEKFKAADYPAAETFAITCLKAAEKECAKTDACYEKALNNLALVYEAMEQYEPAINYLSEIFKTQTTRIENIDPNFGMVIASYYDMYKSIQDPKIAIKVYKKTIERLRQIKAVDNTIYYELVSIYTTILTEQANPGQVNAEENLLKTTREKYGEKSKEYLSVLDSVAFTNKTYGKYHLAKPQLMESKRIREKNGTKNSIEYARVCTQLGYVYFVGQKADSAIMYYSEGLSVWKKTGKTKETDYAEAFLYYAMSYQFKQDWAKCCELYEEALPIVKSVFGEKHFWYSTVLVSLGSFHKILKNIDKSEFYYLEDVRCKKNNKDTVEMNYLADYWGLANIYDIKGDGKKSAFYFKKINDMTLQNIQLLVSSMNVSSEKRIAQSMVGFQFSLDWLYSFMSRQFNDSPELAGYIYNDELVKKGLVMRVIKSKMEAALSSYDTALIRGLDQWLLLRQQISKLSLLPVSERKSNLATIEKEAKKIEDEMFYKLYLLQKDKVLASDWKEVQKALKPGEASIEFFNFDFFDNINGRFPDSNLYYAVILRPEYSYPKMIYLFRGQEFTSFLQRNTAKTPFEQVRRLYTWSNDPGQSKYKGDSTYNFIWKPLEKELDGVKTIYYSPSGLLHKISFSAIPLNDSTSLVDRYHLRQMTSTAMIVNRKDSFTLSEDYKALLYGGILYDLDTASLEKSVGKYKVHGDFFIRDRSFEVTDSIRGGGTWAYLEGTLKEVDLIDSLFIGSRVTSKVLSKSDAVEESFKYTEEFFPEIIHIATHGYFLPDPEPPKRDPMNAFTADYKAQVNTDETMLRSGLLFAGANSTWQGKKPGIGLDDGILTAYEVSRLNLSRTKLVVLSACETGLGEVKGSEGVFGLQRAFKLAGVDYIIMSLWQIPDAQTVELMRLFYSAWLKGMDIRDAFLYAQREMNKEYEAYFWAGFVLLE